MAPSMDTQLEQVSSNDGVVVKTRKLMNNVNVLVSQAQQASSDPEKEGIIVKLNSTVQQARQVLKSVNDTQLVQHANETIAHAQLAIVEVSTLCASGRQTMGSTKDSVGGTLATAVGTGAVAGVIGAGAELGACTVGAPVALAAGALCLVINLSSGTPTLHSFQESDSPHLSQVRAERFQTMTIDVDRDGVPTLPKLPFWCIMWESGVGHIRYWLFDDFAAAVQAIDSAFAAPPFGLTRILFTYNPATRSCVKELYSRGINSAPLNSIRAAATSKIFPTRGPKFSEAMRKMLVNMDR